MISTRKRREFSFMEEERAPLNHLIVTREPQGILALRVYRSGKLMETVKADGITAAQMLLDYFQRNWPVGTRLEWKVVGR